MPIITVKKPVSGVISGTVSEEYRFEMMLTFPVHVGEERVNNSMEDKDEPIFSVNFVCLRKESS